MGKSGLTLPGYNYCGPFNKEDAGEPTNDLDRACRTHDRAYSKMGNKAYWQYSRADQKLYNRASWKTVGGALVKTFFGAKKLIAPKMSMTTSQYHAYRQALAANTYQRSKALVKVGDGGPRWKRRPIARNVRDLRVSRRKPVSRLYGKVYKKRFTRKFKRYTRRYK